jgi:Ti-type conjugative transfer relaxase TraA
LAIYHLTATVVSRARGQRIVAAAAARSGAKLRDDYYQITHNFTRKRGVVHTEIMAPAGAPTWVHDREALWNRVEAGERRRDSQLARAIEVGLPIELSHEESVALLREYIAQEFVAQGMIADFSIRRLDPSNPHAQILLTLRTATAVGFGPKMRHWNRKTNLLEWRSSWAERANRHLARAGHAVRIDHRTLEAQRIELAPGRRTGLGRGLESGDGLPSHLGERLAEQQRIARENGATILEDPTVVLRALTRQRSTFTIGELAQFLRSRTDGAAQAEEALFAIRNSDELVPLDPGEGSRSRFTTRDMLEAEKSLLKRAGAMATRRGHAAPPPPQEFASPRYSMLSDEQQKALGYLVSEGDFKAVAEAGSGRGALLAAARAIWDAQGFRVVGAALTGVAATTLAASSGIKSRPLECHEQDWLQGRDPLTPNDVLVVDGAEMIGLKQLERILAVADKARAKVALIGDSEQMQAMGALSPLQPLVGRYR